MSLYIHPPSFDLPSMDPESLKFLAAARFCAADIRVIYCERPTQSPSGTLPCYHIRDSTITNFDEFVGHLRTQHSEIQLDSDLDPEQKAMLHAYTALLERTLIPALVWKCGNSIYDLIQEQAFWVDEYNFTSLMSGIYSNTMTFPFSIYFLNKRRRKADRVVKYYSKLPEEMQLDAIKTLSLLSVKLGESKYFNGTRPSSLDALLFGHLAPLLKLPLANDRLQLHLRAVPNLVLFLESILSIYMPISEEQLKENGDCRRKLGAQVEKAKKALEKQRAENQQRRAEEKRQTRDQSWNVAFFVALSVTASILFAVHTGILKLPNIDDDSQEILE